MYARMDGWMWLDWFLLIGGRKKYNISAHKGELRERERTPFSFATKLGSVTTSRAVCVHRTL